MEDIKFIYETIFEKRTIIALEDKVISETKTLTYNDHFEYRYSELTSNVIHGKVGDNLWSNIGGSLLLASALFVTSVRLFIPEYYFTLTNRIFPISLLTLSLIMFSIKGLFKNECIWILHKKEDMSIFFKLNKNNREQGHKVKDFIINKVRQEDK